MKKTKKTYFAFKATLIAALVFGAISTVFFIIYMITGKAINLVGIFWLLLLASAIAWLITIALGGSPPKTTTIPKS